jgi:hypothetical protein
MATGVAIGMRGISAAAYEFINVLRYTLTAGEFTSGSGFRYTGYGSNGGPVVGSTTPSIVGYPNRHVDYKETLPGPTVSTTSDILVGLSATPLTADWLVFMSVNGVIKTGPTAEFFTNAGLSGQNLGFWRWNMPNAPTNPNPAGVPFGFVSGNNYPVIIIHK